MKNSKTDTVDADTLAEYAARMDFVAWMRPSNEKLALRDPRLSSPAKASTNQRSGFCFYQYPSQSQTTRYNRPSRSRFDFMLEAACREAEDVSLLGAFAKFQALLDHPLPPNDKLRRLLKTKAPWRNDRARFHTTLADHC